MKNESFTIPRCLTDAGLQSSDLRILDGNWYVTHAGLLRLALRRRCVGIHTEVLLVLCNIEQRRWAFKATVYKSRTCKGFVGYGDADPSNVSEVVRGAEMRVAETRAVNRALRKAYGIGICSVEEIGSVPVEPKRPPVSAKAPCRRVLPSGNGSGNGDGRPRLRDRLRQLIRQHELDPVLVKSYALDFCRTKSLADANREQIAKFIDHLADRAARDREALVAELNRYLQPQERAS